MEWILSIVFFTALTYIVLGYILAPLVVKFTHYQAATPQIPATSFDELPESEQAYAREAREQLLDIGFLDMGWMKLADYVPNVEMIFNLLVYPEQHTAAIVATAIPQTRNMPVKSYVEFSTDLIDDQQISTNNNNDIPPFPTACKWVNVAPRFREVLMLYRLHQGLIEHYGRGTTVKPLPMDLDPATLLRMDMDVEHRNAVAADYLALDAAADRYRPTWKGAFLLTWKELWPVKQVRRWNANRQINQLAQQLGLDPAQPDVLVELPQD